jgi:acid phosphatase family membrane protein YuiD
MSAPLSPVAADSGHLLLMLRDLADNSVLWWVLAACGLAQLSKLVIELVVHRRWRPAVLVETGGMPSSHSALMTGTTAAIGWSDGFQSPVFGLAAALTFIVLYDASGVRRAAGLISRRVNGLPDSLWAFESGNDPPPKPLKENLGHTRAEVLVGSLLGPLVSLPGLALLGSPLHLAQQWGLTAWFAGLPG